MTVRECDINSVISLASFCEKKTNSADSDQNAASDQDLHCLLTECSIKI